MMAGTPFITTRLNAVLATLVLAGVSALLAGGGGYVLGHRVAKADGDADLAKLQRSQADRQRQAAADALIRHQQAQARADALEVRLATAEQTRQTQAQEHAREIKRLTTGRACLNAGTVRLLNEPAIGLRLPALPAPTGGAAATDAAVASDTDVAGWIDGARRQYDACRSRLDALIDWWEPTAHD